VEPLFFLGVYMCVCVCVCVCVCGSVGVGVSMTSQRGVRGLVVMIVACQVMDPGSIPGERIFLWSIVKGMEKNDLGVR
jgi:hypothetical protein